MSALLDMLNEHVYLILFISLILEFVGIPIPGETMMALAGVIGYNGYANYWMMVISGSIGTIIGMQLSYEVGRRLGTRAINKYGKYMGLTPKRMDSANKFFNKYGPIVIFIAYYLPGVRHILGYFSGISKIDARKFHIYSTIGGILWVFTFITMGYILGPSWKYVFHIMHKYGALLVILALIGLFVYLAYKKLGKEEFLYDLKKYKLYFIPILFIGVLSTSIFIFLNLQKRPSAKFVDDIFLFVLALILLVLIVIYVRISSRNRTSENLLIVVDYQNDFVDGGALPVPDSARLDNIISEKIEKYLEQKEDVIFTLDTHGDDYLETREGKFLPLPHCYRLSDGHNLYGKTASYKERAKEIFEKDTFGSLELAQYISKSNYKKIELCGLVSNICVLSNIILIQNFNKDVEIVVDLKSTLSNEKIVNDTFAIYLKSLGVTVIE